MKIVVIPTDIQSKRPNMAKLSLVQFIADCSQDETLLGELVKQLQDDSDTVAGPIEGEDVYDALRSILTPRKS